MSSFSVISKKNRFKLGIIVVIIIHIGFFYGFWRVKAGQVGNKVVELDIYAARAAEGLAFYEAIPSEECVKVVNEQAPRLGMPIFTEPSNEIKAADGAVESTPVSTPPTPDTTAKTPPTEVKLAPSLFYASAPRCKGVTNLPAGVEKLGADGFIGLELNINTAGLVQHGEINRSSGFEDLDAAALKQVKENWIFKPCQKGTAIVGCKQVVKFRWKNDSY